MFNDIELGKDLQKMSSDIDGLKAAVASLNKSRVADNKISNHNIDVFWGNITNQRKSLLWFGGALICVWILLLINEHDKNQLSDRISKLEENPVSEEKQDSET